MEIRIDVFGSRKIKHTSVDVVRSADQSSRGSTLASSWGLISTSSLASSASLGCKGKESDEDLQLLTAQVRKLRVRTFMTLDVLVMYTRSGERVFF